MNIQKNRSVALWLLFGAVLIIIQILLGGITRLTGSGLSITEWKPILGTLPPLNDQEWAVAFEKYKQIAQYKYIHNYFTLRDFKFIYFWEWLHRNWGRFMGLVFIGPFVYFIYKRKITRSMFWPMVLLFLLGGLQGAIGWIMVKSGVGTSLVYVSHIRLAAHFIAALILLVYVVWFALYISVPQSSVTAAFKTRRLSIFALSLLAVQLTYGAFMAGTHAAKSAITWPTINGSFVPKALFTEGSFYNDLLHNLITIQFVHRNLACLIAIIVVLITWQLRHQPRATLLYKIRWWPLALVLLQVTLGILALVNYLNSTQLVFSILHQLFGILLLLGLVVVYFFSRGKAG